MAAVTFRELHGRIKARVETVSGFKEALRPINPTSDPNTLGDRRYAIELGTANTAIMRDKAASVARIDHGVTVRFLRRLPPKDQNTRYLEALDEEVLIIRALMAQSGAWQYDLRVLFNNSGREVIAGGEWLLSTIQFSIAHDLALA